MRTGNQKVVLYLVPFQDRFLIYRPLLHLAFMGNRAMAGVAKRYAGRVRGGFVPPADLAAFSFLHDIGFLQPDPPPPSLPPVDSYRPSTAVLLMTNRCNLRCTYCYAAAGEEAEESMQLPLAKQVIDIVARNAETNGQPSFDLVFHGGGEPVQHWDVFKQTVQYARDKPLRCNISLSSNGLWSAAQRDFLLAQVDGISLSFDGSPEVQDAQRPTAGGRSSFAAVMKSIREMDRRKFPYNIRLTASGRWIDALPESVRFLCEETGCRHFQVEPAFNTGRGGWQNPGEAEADRFIQAFNAAMNVAFHCKAELMYAGARPWMTVCSFCSAADSALVVRPDGTLVACYEITSARHSLADIFSIGGMSARGVRIDHRKRERLSRMRTERLKLCEDCFCRWHCGGDCSSRCFSEDGKAHLRLEQRCRINREISKEVLARYIERSGGVWRGSEHIFPHADCEMASCDECGKGKRDKGLVWL